jgi:hypothetical protein
MSDRKRETAARFDAIRGQYNAHLNFTDYPGQIALIFELDTEVCLITEDGEFGNAVRRRAQDRSYSQHGFQDLFYGHCDFQAERVLLISQINRQNEAAFFCAVRDRASPGSVRVNIFTFSSRSISDSFGLK